MHVIQIIFTYELMRAHLQDLDQAVQVDPSNSQAYYLRSKINRTLKRLDAAVAVRIALCT